MINSSKYLNRKWKVLIVNDAMMTIMVTGNMLNSVEIFADEYWDNIIKQI